MLNPVLLSLVLIVVILSATGTSYDTYFDGAQFVHFLLGPATVALAIPLFRQLDRIRRSAVAVIASIAVGSVTAASSAVAIAWLLDGSRQTLISLAPKSVTAPVAMGISEKIGGIPSLTAVIVVLTGIVAATLGRFVFEALGVGSHAVRGFAIGLAGHGQGVARAFIVSDEAGAFAGLAMGLTALATALIAPWLAPRLISLLG